MLTTADGQKALSDSKSLRRAMLMQKVPYCAMPAGAAVTQAIAALKAWSREARPLQAYF